MLLPAGPNELRFVAVAGEGTEDLVGQTMVRAASKSGRVFERGRSERSDSVLDESAETRAVKRLFVADNSALANGIGGPNPTLTTQALATRTAEIIYIRYFGGHPWVDREEPVSSVDPVVTRAVVRAGLA